jgi:hypothetical protein
VSAVRFSIGLEDLEDLKADFVQAFKAVVEVRNFGSGNILVVVFSTTNDFFARARFA